MQTWKKRITCHILFVRKRSCWEYVQRTCRTAVDLIRSSLLGVQLRRLSFTTLMEMFDVCGECSDCFWQCPSCGQGGGLLCGPGMAGVLPGAGGRRCAFCFETSTSHQMSPNAFALTTAPVFLLFLSTNFPKSQKSELI